MPGVPELGEKKMSKSVLVIDTPKKCDSCIYVGTFHPFCKINCRDIKDTSIKPDWCPLKPLPKYKSMEKPGEYEYGKMHGWNQCIDEITGES